MNLASFSIKRVQWSDGVALRCVVEVLLVVLVLSEGGLVTLEAEAGDIERAEKNI